MKKFHYVMALLIIASMILCACGSGCEKGDTEAQCRARSPIEQPIKDFGQSSDSVIHEVDQTIDDYVVPNAIELTAIAENDTEQNQAFGTANQFVNDYVQPNPVELTAIAEYEYNENIVVAKANRTYTNWWLGLAEAIFGSTP